MIWNIGIIWVDQRVDLATPLGAVPASWFNSVDSFSSILVAAAAGRACGRGRRGAGASREALTKMAIGCAI